MAASMCCACRKIFPRILWRSISSSGHQCHSTAVEHGNQTVVDQKITIPFKKNRDALSILKALSSTVKQDVSSPPYRYMDDPYFIPGSNIEKRSYTLSRASGKKAAKFIFESYPQLFEKPLFMNDPAEPLPKVFFSSPAEPVCGEDTEAGLLERIEMKKPSLAYQSFQKIREAGGEVSQESQQRLLDLLCLHNSQDPTEALLPEERWFQRELGQDNSRKIRKTWKDNGAAELVFADLAEKSAEAYSSMIRGCAKYHAADRLWDLFCEMKDKGYTVELEVYNAVLRSCQLLKDMSRARWELIQSILSEMSAADIKPNLGTFNSVLYVLSRNFRFKETPSLVLQTINEMRALDLEPSLASWYYALQVMYAEDETESNFLYQVLDHLEGKDLEIRDPDDFEFFTVSMVKCFFNIKDMELVYKLDKLLHHGENIKLLGDGYKQTLYHYYMFRLMCTMEPIDKIMDFYDRVTPHIWTPGYSNLTDLLNTIDLHEGYKYLPRIWSDLQLFDYSKRPDLVGPLVSLMAKKQHAAEFQSSLCDISWSIKKKAEEAMTFIKPLQLSGEMVGDMSLICLRADNFDRAWELFQLYEQKRNRISGFPSEVSLEALANRCMEAADSEKAIRCLTIMCDLVYPKSQDVADSLKEKLTLTEAQRDHIKEIL